jgi:UDP-N-acetylmuramate dehydrogenase
VTGDIASATRSGAGAASVTLENSLRLPARAAERVPVASVDDLRRARRLADDHGLKLLPLGAGSNVVLPEQLDAVVLQSANREVEVLREEGDAVVLRVGAACDWHTLVRRSLRDGLCGLENLALIPGTVGAAPIQNIGAYGRELEEFVVAVHGYDVRGHEERVFTREECAFAYRDSVFRREFGADFLITAVDLRLSRSAELRLDYPALAERMRERGHPEDARGVCAAVMELRREKLPDPEQAPNAGSFFKNPTVDASTAEALAREHPGLPRYAAGEGRSKLPAAWLIEACGYRGRGTERTRVSPRHALVIENLGGATQDDVLDLAAGVRGAVQDRFGVHLEVEPRVYTTAGTLDARW